MAGMQKDLARSMGLFCLVDPNELSGPDEWAEWLLDLGSGLCDVVERDGELVLLEVRRRVAVIDHGMRVEIYPGEHAPPHFHVKSESINASFSIDDCSLLRGNVTSGAMWQRFTIRISTPETDARRHVELDPGQGTVVLVSADI